ncbi:MAG: leucine-rich repeat protein [Acutalibacteraceae bacterium]|nr:leucine-rich repeat protein [Acutalibacteraceae bacterium]
MKKLSKCTRKILSVLLTTLMVLAIFTVAPISASAKTTLDVLRSKYPHGSYWNGSYNGRAWQCHGFALQLGYELTDSDPYGWATYENNNITNYIANGNLKPGDIIRTWGNGHTIMVTNVNGNAFNFVDCNFISSNTVRWDGYCTISNNNYLSTFGAITYIKSSPTNVVTQFNPTGAVDSITGGTNSVKIRGWAFDKDDVSTQLNIHVYVGGPAGSGAPGYSYVANTYRPDVNNVYNVGEWHGYDIEIPVTTAGDKAVYVYAINVGGGENVLLGHQTVYIDGDIYCPVIQSIYITDVTPYAFTVNAVISDNIGVTEVKFPTWKDGSPDVKWYVPKQVDTNVYSYRVYINDLTNEPGVYHTHVYAYDAARNENVSSIDILVPDKGLLIYDIVGDNIHIQGVNDKTVQEVSIPSNIGGRSVTEISDNAFLECTNMVKITLPDTIIRIGNNAFRECWHLKEFVCPPELSSLGNDVFSSCYGLSKITFNNKINSIGARAFYTTNLKSVNLPKSLSSIGEYAFGYKYNADILPERNEFKIYGYRDTQSQIYAQKNNIEFVEIKTIGDINEDGEITLEDTILVLRHIVSAKDISDEPQDIGEMSLADMNSDGKITVVDVLMLQKMILS